jgi:hypothetical protein
VLQRTWNLFSPVKATPVASRAVKVVPLFARLFVQGDSMTGEAPPSVAEVVGVDVVLEDFWDAVVGVGVESALDDVDVDADV